MRLVRSAALVLAASSVLTACSVAREVDASGTGGAMHEVPFVDAHTSAALAGMGACALCHGVDYGGGLGPSCTGCHEERLGVADWRTNCTFCHGTRTAAGLAATPGAASALAAPPATVTGTGDQTSANPKVGAHQRHLVAGTYSAPLACGSCHAVPAQTFPGSLDHLDGTAAVQFSAAALQGVANPGYAGAGGSCAVYCHGSTSLLFGGTNKTPAWTSSGGVVCGSCHTLSPTSGQHVLHLVDCSIPCASCHPGYSIPDLVNTATHVNGVFDASPIVTTATFSSWPSGAATCSGCHGADIPTHCP